MRKGVWHPINGAKSPGITALPEKLVPLADSLDLPWRDAGCRERKPTAVEPHKCRKETRVTRIRGELVKIERRY